MHLRILFISFLLLVCAVQKGIAQDDMQWPKLERSYINHFYQKSDAYSQKCFQNILTDQKGRLWLMPCELESILNAIGRFRFDGYTFQPVEIVYEDGTILEEHEIRGMDKQGRMLLKNADFQVFVMNPDSQVCHPIPVFDDGKISELHSYGLSANNWGTFAMGISNDSISGLFELKGEQFHKVQSFRYPEGPDPWIPHGMLIEEKVVWMTSPDLHVIRFDRQRNSTELFEVKDFIEAPPMEPLSRQFSQPRPKIFKTPSSDIYVILPALDGKHPFQFSYDKNQFVSIAKRFPSEWSLESAFQDESGQICWLFRDQAGNFRALLEGTNGQYFDYSEVIAGQNSIGSLVSPNFRQQAYMLTDKGLSIAMVRDQQLIRQILPNQWISSVAELKEGRFLINTLTNGWFVHDLADGSTLPYDGPDCGVTPSAFGFGMKQQIIPDEEGYLWFLSMENLVRFDPGTQTCTSIPLNYAGALFAKVRNDLVVIQHDRRAISFVDLNTKKELSFGPGVQRSFKGFVRDILVSAEGLIWILTNNGLWKIDIYKEQSELLDRKDGFEDSRFTSIWEDEEGWLWLGTYFGGLHRYNPKTGDILIINKGHGLSSNAIMSIITDDEGDLWVGTEYGINLISKAGEVLHSLHQEDGLVYEVYERFDPFKDSSGRLWFGSREGISIIDPVALKADLKTDRDLQIYLTEVSYFDKNIGERVLQTHNFSKDINLDISAEQPYLRLKFGLSSYLEPKENRYAYMLEGKDKDWHYLGTQPELNISRLPAGKYRLLIKGADFRNNWTADPIAINIHAREFFYKQAWFYLLLALPFIAFGLLWARNKQQEASRLENEVQLRTRQIREDKKLIEQQADELKQLDELKSRFFTNISHELRTPVTLIKAPLEHLLQTKGYTSAEAMKKSLQRVVNNAGKLSRLIEELLDLSKLEARKAKLKEEPTPLAAFCRQLFASYESGAQLKSIEYRLESELRADDFYLIDRNRFEKIVNNLLSNALKFTPENGSIKMRAKEEGERIIIEVADSGRGIPKEDLPHVFDRYFQTRKEEIGTEGGTGIGLALSREMAQLMNGILSVNSTWGEGATFALTIPAKPVEANDAIQPITLKNIATDTAPAKVKAPEKPAGGDHPKILIVEDNADLQQLLLDLLSEAYHCQVANHGAEAWQWLESNDPKVQGIKLIISDVMMPEMDGYTLLEKIKADAYWSKTPVIMLTARSAEEDKLQALRMGVDDYLLKPFSPDELKARIQNLVQNFLARQIPAEQEPKHNKPPDFSFQLTETSADQQWLQEIEEATKNALEKGIKLNTLVLAEQVFLSERQFARRLKKLTGLTPNAYIQEARLQLARQLLERQTYTTVNEVAQAAGYSSGSYLSKVFHERFGKKPGEYFN